MKSIGFVHRGGPDMASYRYRAQIPADYLKSEGVEVTVNQGECDIVVFAKPMPGDEELCKRMKSEGAKIVVDITDPHFNHPTYGPLLTSLVKMADVLTCSSEFAQQSLCSVWHDKPVHYIPDPYEFDEVTPHAEGDKTIWFGHRLNLEEVKPLRKFNPKIITGPDVIKGTTFYSRTNLIRGCREANVALLPYKAGDDYKSPNRGVTAIRLGLFPLVGNIPGYREMRHFLWIGNVSFTGIRWARYFKDDLNELVKEGQDYIKDRFSPQTIGEKWKQLLESI